MKIIIAGSRENFTYGDVAHGMAEFIRVVQPRTIEIVSGHARGVDKFGEQWARDNGHKLTLFYADWDTHGKRAGMLRNVKMANYAGASGALVAFWNGTSTGTRQMIDIATDNGLIISVWGLNK